MNQPGDAIRKELAGLTCRLLENQLTAEDDARLTEILNTCPVLIEDYTNQIHLDALLTSNLYAGLPEGVSLETLETTSSAENQSATTTVAAVSVEPSVRRRFSFLLRTSARTTALVMVMLLVGVVLWLNSGWWESEPREQIAVMPKIERENAISDYVGMLLDTEDAVWEDERLGDDIAYGTRFEAGQALWLKSGIARIRFQSGAGVVLEGPAKIELRSPLQALLHFGKLAAYVPDEAHGFTVETLKLRIVDQGTRFGTVVDPLGKAEVHVFEGAVDIKPVAADKQVTNLKASRARLFANGTSNSAEISVTPTKFADVPTPEQLTAAKSGNYPPTETIQFDGQEPMNQIALTQEKSALPAGILVGEDFEYLATSLLQQTGGVGFSYEGWWADPNFTRLMVPEKRMQWGGLDGGPRILHARGHHHAYPSLAHRIARKLEAPLTDDFYFSILVQYDGVDADDFFGLWFDNSMGGMGTSHSQVPTIGFKEGQFFARFHVKDEAFFQQPVDGDTFLLVGHLSKKKSAGYNHFEFWVNPIGDRRWTPDVKLWCPKVAKRLRSIQSLGVRIGQYTEVTDSLYLDRLVIGETYESVTKPAAPVQK